MPSQKAESERALSDSLQRALACRALERSIGVCDGFALGVLYRARCRLVMKLRLDGLWSRSPNLLLELRDLRRACPAMGSVAGACREGGAESNCSGKRNLFLAKHCRISWLSVLGQRDIHEQNLRGHPGALVSKNPRERPHSSSPLPGAKPQFPL